jgi:hypothetical protein
MNAYCAKLMEVISCLVQIECQETLADSVDVAF